MAPIAPIFGCFIACFALEHNFCYVLYRFERAEISGNESLMMTRRERLGGTRGDQHFDRQRSCSMNLWAKAQFPSAFLSDGFTSIVISINISRRR